MNDFTIFGLGGAAATSLLVSVIKKLFPKLADRWAVLTSIGVGLLLSILAYLGDLYPGAAVALNVVGGGLLAGLGACGLHSLTKKR